MLVSTTELQNNFGKYLKLCESRSIVITKNGKKRALLLAIPPSANGYETAESDYSYGSAAHAPNPVTYREYLRLIEESGERYELIDGEVFLMSAPGVTHQRVLGRLFLWFNGVFIPGQPCEVFMSPFDTFLYRRPLREERDLTEDDTNVVQPDLLVLCDHADRIDDKDRYTGTPTLVVEIISPSTRSNDKVRKLDLYMESGIEEYWTVDPKTHGIAVYRFSDYLLEDDALYTTGQTARSFRFPQLSVPVDAVFRDARSK